MTDETTRRISAYCSRYGDKLLEIMSRCCAMNTLDVPEEEALLYLKELEESDTASDRCKVAEKVARPKG